jgi:hypothetical protein
MIKSAETEKKEDKVKDLTVDDLWAAFINALHRLDKFGVIIKGTFAIHQSYFDKKPKDFKEKLLDISFNKSNNTWYFKVPSVQILKKRKRRRGKLSLPRKELVLPDHLRIKKGAENAGQNESGT